MIEHIMKKIGDELKMNPTLEYSPSMKFKASLPDVSLMDINNFPLPNFVRSDTAEKAIFDLYNMLKSAHITIYSYPQDEEFAYVGNCFERVHNVEIL